MGLPPAVKIQMGSGNVFQDIGLKAPKELDTRSRVMRLVAESIKDRQLNQREAARVLGISQPKVSCLMNGKLSMFSLDQLFTLLNALDNNVEIIIRPSGKSGATTTVRLAHKGTG